MTTTRGRPAAATTVLAAGMLVGGAVPAAAGAVPQSTTGQTRVVASGQQGESGCRRLSTQRPGTSVAYSLRSQGRTRTYRVHLPKSYTPQRHWPVVLAFHGRGNSGAETEAFSGLSRLPAILVYPDGVVGTDGEKRAWQGAPYSAPGVDDVAFTRELLNRVSRQACVNPSRVYATGKPNGAGFTNLLACRLRSRIAAIAPVAPALYPGTRQGCDAARPTPVLQIHGTGDTTIPYAGDTERGLPAIRSWVAGWAERDRCAPRPQRFRPADDVTVWTYRGCARGSSVAHVAVTGGGHTWPGADAYSGGGYTTQSVEATDLAWGFMSRFSLHQGPRGGRA